VLTNNYVKQLIQGEVTPTTGAQQALDHAITNLKEMGFVVQPGPKAAYVKSPVKRGRMTQGFNLDTADEIIVFRNGVVAGLEIGTPAVAEALTPDYAR
jgi:hypothetical protein